MFAAKNPNKYELDHQNWIMQIFLNMVGKISWKDKVTNNEVLQKFGTEKYVETIETRDIVWTHQDPERIPGLISSG